MKQNFRKTPNFILDKINDYGNKDIIVGTIINLSEEDILELKYSHVGIIFKNGELIYQEEIIPSSDNGRYSKKNIEGYIYKDKSKPKIMENIYLGERPYFGDWSKGSFSCYRNMEVYQKIIYPANEKVLNIELLKEIKSDGEKKYRFSVKVKEILNVKNKSFEDDLLFNINLIQENIGSVDVFETDLDLNKYHDTKNITWDIFPPGRLDKNIEKILGDRKKYSSYEVKDITDRIAFIHSLKPKNIILGESGMRKYFGAQFSDDLVLFENQKYGNSIYILYENWKELSKLSRTEIQNRPQDQFVRIIHNKNWKTKVKNTINSKLN